MRRHLPPVPSATAKLVKALTPDLRTALVREVLLGAEALIMSLAFQAAHIKVADRAVDHGIEALEITRAWLKAL